MERDEGRLRSGPAGGGGVRLRRALSASLLLACSAAFAATYAVRAPATAGGAGPARAARAAPSRGAEDFSKFSHESAAHRGLACDSCHRRADNSAAPRLPGHKACVDCHLQQFVAAPELPMCAICHTQLDARVPPVKNFPRLQSFNARFDHAQHSSGAGLPERGCAACHEPARRGAALSIPAGLDAHARCYACHTPGATSAGRDIGSCGACHALAPYRPTPTDSRAFRLGFSHAAHGARQRLDCASCHRVRAGAGQGRQVGSPAPSQHFPPARAQSCETCHDNRRAFGGEDFSDCKRCHKGASFRL